MRCSGADTYSGAVTDWARFLPLSNRDGDDDGAVSRDRSPAVAQLLRAIATALDAQPTLHTAPTLRPQVSGNAAVREVLSELRAPWWRRWATSVGAVEVPRPEVAAIPVAELPGALRARAGTLVQPGVRAGIRDLGSVLVLALDLKAAHDLAIEVIQSCAGPSLSTLHCAHACRSAALSLPAPSSPLMADGRSGEARSCRRARRPSCYSSPGVAMCRPRLPQLCVAILAEDEWGAQPDSDDKENLHGAE